MRKVVMCDYCNYIGTEEEIAKHEECLENPNVHCCANCRWAHEISSVLIPPSDLKAVGIDNPHNTAWTAYGCAYNEEKRNWDESTMPIVASNKMHGVPCEHYERGTPSKVVSV